MKARKSILAGSWYPGTAADCEKEIKQFLSESTMENAPIGNAIGRIVPHAGWYFSGALACNVIHSLSRGRTPDVLVIFGMHLHPKSPAFIMTEGQWETPFGNLTIASPLARELIKKFDFQIETADQCVQDNTIELQLPFVKYFFKDVNILPVGVPPAQSTIEIAQEIGKIAHELDLKIMVLGSTDLTHYGANYGFMPKGEGLGAFDWVKKENDRRVIDAMLAMDPVRVLQEAAESHNACCAGAVAAAIATARQIGPVTARLLAYASSYDKSPGSSFVGYVGIVFEACP